MQRTHRWTWPWPSDFLSVRSHEKHHRVDLSRFYQPAAISYIHGLASLGILLRGMLQGYRRSEMRTTGCREWHRTSEEKCTSGKGQTSPSSCPMNKAQWLPVYRRIQLNWPQSVRKRSLGSPKCNPMIFTWIEHCITPAALIANVSVPMSSQATGESIDVCTIKN